MTDNILLIMASEGYVRCVEVGLQRCPARSADVAGHRGGEGMRAVGGDGLLRPVVYTMP